MGFTKDIVEFAMSTSGDEVPVQAHGDDLVAHGLVCRNHCGRPASRIVLRLVKQEQGVAESSM